MQTPVASIETREVGLHGYVGYFFNCNGSSAVGQTNMRTSREALVVSLREVPRLYAEHAAVY
jgi:hypothetical protein